MIGNLTILAEQRGFKVSSPAHKRTPTPSLFRQRSIQRNKSKNNPSTLSSVNVVPNDRSEEYFPVFVPLRNLQKRRWYKIRSEDGSGESLLKGQDYNIETLGNCYTSTYMPPVPVCKRSISIPTDAVAKTPVSPHSQSPQAVILVREELKNGGIRVTLANDKESAWTALEESNTKTEEQHKPYE
jgi:hypothetical protein